MKFNRQIIIFSLVLLSIFSFSFKSQAVPPLKPEYLAHNRLLNVESPTLPQPLFMLDVPGIEKSEPTFEEKLDKIAGEIADYASKFLGRRYVWGATGPKNFDCSGFTSYVFRKVGIRLNRTSRMQYAQGEKVDRDEIRPGDLMFFSSPRTRRGVVGHVGIVVDVENDGSCTFIHASTSKGITYQRFPDGGYFSRAYIGARRVIS